MNISVIMKSGAICAIFLLFCWISVMSAEEIELCESAGKFGKCISIRECPSLYNLTKRRPISTIPQTDKDLLKKSHCGFSGITPKVCCTETIQNRINEPIPDEVLPPPSISKKLLPATLDCGIDSQERIVGGESTKLDEFPWMALIKYESRRHLRSFKCGGVLISKRYVLTAAHCLKNSYWKLVVTLGDYNKDSTEDCIDNGFIRECLKEPPVDVSVEEVHVHEKYKYNDPNQQHDIAILRLDNDVKYSDYVRPICLPLSEEERNKTYYGANLTVAGWGITENGSSSSVKLKLEVPVVSNEECYSIYTEQNRTLNDDQLCAGGVINKNSCKGDSGGPLMTLSVDEYGETIWYAAGIVSFGPEPCGFEGWPTVYTKVSKYLGWILRHMRE